MVSMRWLGATGAVLLAMPAAVRAEPLFASPPHFVDARDRQQVVFFLNEPVSGALASRTGPTSVEVLVPRSDADPTLLGKDFGALRWRAEDGGVRRLVLNAAERRTQIRIETGRPVVQVDARAADDPPRLVIDLIATAPTATPRSTRTPGARATPAAKASAAPRSADEGEAMALADLLPTLAVAAPAAPAIGDLLEQMNADASPAPRATPARMGAASPAPAATVERAGGIPAVLEAPVVPLPPVDHALVEPLGAVGPPAAPTEPASAPGPAALPTAAPARARPCRFERVHGVPLCAPDPTAPPYAGEPSLAAVTALLRGRTGAVATPGRDASAASLYLAADAAYARGAATGRLLNAVSAYQRALRHAPEFVDAPRARLNTAFALRAMRLETELALAADAAARDPEGGIAAALVGDLAREVGAAPKARAAYERAAAADAAGACLAARGRAALAVDAGNLEGATQALGELAELCPPAFRSDPETALVQARADVLAGKARAAVPRLEGLRGKLGVLGEGQVQVELAAAREALGEPDAARTLYETVVRERRGEPSARRAAVRLAFLEGAVDGVHAGIRRLDRHLAGGAAAPRRTLWMQALRDALASGAPVEAAAVVDEGGLDDDRLSPDERVLVAAAYTGVGLPEAAERVLRPAQGPHAPAGVWEGLGDALLAQRRWHDARALADEWTQAGGTGPAAALRARALAGAGDAAAALAAVDGATPEVRAEVALTVAVHDPAAAVLALTALALPDAPPLPPATHARVLRALAEAAERTGDLPQATAAFTELAIRHADQPAAGDAAYRAARLAGGAGWEAAETRGDPFARRVAAALRASEAMLRSLGAPVEREGTP